MQDALMDIVILLLMIFAGFPAIVIGLCVAVDWLEEKLNKIRKDDDQNMDKDSRLCRDSGHGGDAGNDSRATATEP